MVSLSNHLPILRQAQDERYPGAVAGYKPAPTQVKRSINPSFRRKPESRRFDSRHILFWQDFLDSDFRRNDGCLK